jgi:hypothetical protein
LVAKPLNTTNYHLATFDHKLHSNCKLPRHIVADVTPEAIQAEIKEATERERIGEDMTLAEAKPALVRKINRMRYKFEEELEYDEESNLANGGGAGSAQHAQKYKGYLDDNYSASATSGSSYAIMIYDVRR